MNDSNFFSMQCNKDAGELFCESFIVYCSLLIDISASLNILDNIRVIISTKKSMVRIPLLVLHLVQALGTAEGFIYLVTK